MGVATVPEPDKVWTVEDHLRDASPEHVALYHAVAALIAEQGPVTLSVSKTTITFKGTRRGFADPSDPRR